MSERPVDVQRLIKHARQTGWFLVPQVYGTPDMSLIRWVDQVVDVVTTPLLGYSTIVRLVGGPTAGELRETGEEIWRHIVPLPLALVWLNGDPHDDNALVEWETRQAAVAPNRRGATTTSATWPG
jgi:hypothetical protein